MHAVMAFLFFSLSKRFVAVIRAVMPGLWWLWYLAAQPCFYIWRNPASEQVINRSPNTQEFGSRVKTAARVPDSKLQLLSAFHGMWLSVPRQSEGSTSHLSQDPKSLSHVPNSTIHLSFTWRQRFPSTASLMLWMVKGICWLLFSIGYFSHLCDESHD